MNHHSRDAIVVRTDRLVGSLNEDCLLDRREYRLLEPSCTKG